LVFDTAVDGLLVVPRFFLVIPVFVTVVRGFPPDVPVFVVVVRGF